jgi:hypothetical protein
VLRGEANLGKPEPCGSPFRKFCLNVMVVQLEQDRDADNGTGARDRPTRGTSLSNAKWVRTSL